tara:strand:+ start:16789 stop:17271 length:483 start_codon:yes stop_codon:yes gene_type:complete
LAILLLSRISSLRWRTALRRTLLAILTTLWRVLAGRRSAVLALSLRRLTVLSTWRRGAVLALPLRRLAVLSLGWLTVLTLRWSPILALGRLLAVTLLGWAAVLAAWRSTVAAGRGVVGLFVLGVVAAVDSTEEKFDDPEIGGEIDGWVGTSHLFLLVLEV